MDRIPAWAFAVADIAFIGLAIWSAMDENWAGLIAAFVLGGLSTAALVTQLSKG